MPLQLSTQFGHQEEVADCSSPRRNCCQAPLRLGPSRELLTLVMRGGGTLLLVPTLFSHCCHGLCAALLPLSLQQVQMIAGGKQ